MADRVAAALQMEGFSEGAVVAICALSSIEYLAAFLGALRAGMAVAPLAPSSSPQDFAAMLRDCGAKALFMDAATVATLGSSTDGISIVRVSLDDSSWGRPFTVWTCVTDSDLDTVKLDPDSIFNIIYSSGTTGAPKGIVHSHRARGVQYLRNNPPGYGPDAVTMVSTPLYSNTTLVGLIATLAGGGTIVLMKKFDARRFLQLSERHKATHAMLVPVQYRRIMNLLDFEDFDLSSFRMKFATSAPFPAELKADVVKRWPGGLTEYYAMTEGGGTCVLAAHEFPEKLHTVGRPMPDHEILLIDEEGREVSPGMSGEIVGRSPFTMSGYHNAPERTKDVFWHDETGKCFVRTGDIGRFDQDGFLILMDRKKDMIISGGFNIYPSDMEAILTGHESVSDAAVVGVPSDEWGETPVGFVVLKANAIAEPEDLRAWINWRVGKYQRLADLRIVESLPRNPIGKVLKRRLREDWAATRQPAR